jgi:site-specific DNA recombinase
MTRVALYARYSSDNQKESSITDQFRVCEQRASREGWTITARYEDKAISGTQDENGRPGYKALLDAAKAKQFDIILVHDFSRLSRDSVETEQARRRLVHWGVRLIGVSDGIDTGQEGHEMLTGFNGMMNQKYLKDLAKHTRKGMVGQVLKGFHGGGRCFGYRLVPEFDPSKKDPYGHPARIGTRLEIDPEQAQWVRWMFERYADGMSTMKMVEELNRQGVPPPGTFYKRRSAHPPTWCVSALYGNPKYGLGMLNNRRYIGQVTWGRARWPKDPDTKKKQRMLCAEQDWLTQPAEHLRIVDDALWARVKQRQQGVHQASAAIRTALHANARTGRGPKYRFSGLLTCGLCGHKFVILDPMRYGCSGWKYRGLSVCSNTTMAPRKLVEGLLLDAIQKDLFTAEGQALFVQETTKLLAAHRRGQPAEHQRAAKRLQEVDQEIEHLMTAIKAGILTSSTKSALERAEAERTALLQAVQAQHKDVAKVAAFLPNAIGRFKTLIEDLANVTQLQVDRARGLLRVLLGREIVLHPCADGADRYLTAEVTGDYAGLLRLVIGQNKSGGGQGS